MNIKRLLISLLMLSGVVLASNNPEVSKKRLIEKVYEEDNTTDDSEQDIIKKRKIIKRKTDIQNVKPKSEIAKLIEQMPNDCWATIASFQTPEDRLKLRLICKEIGNLFYSQNLEEKPIICISSLSLPYIFGTGKVQNRLKLLEIADLIRKAQIRAINIPNNRCMSKKFFEKAGEVLESVRLDEVGHISTKQLNKVISHCPELKRLWIRIRPGLNTISKSCRVLLDSILCDFGKMSSVFSVFEELPITSQQEAIKNLLCSYPQYKKEFYINWVGLKKLQHLKVNNSSLLTQDAQQILDDCPQLQVLSFRGNQDINLALLKWDAVKNLKRLDLRETSDISGTTLNKLGTACPDLTILKINNVNLDANFEWGKFTKLVKLYLNSDGEGTIAISSFKNLLENCPLENFLFEGALSGGELTNLSKQVLALKCLSIEGNITDTTLCTILNKCPDLKSLYIGNCPELTDVLEQVDLEKLGKLENLSAYGYLDRTSDELPQKIITKCPQLKMVTFGPNKLGAQAIYKGIDSVKEMRRFLKDPDSQIV